MTDWTWGVLSARAMIASRCSSFARGPYKDDYRGVGRWSEQRNDWFWSFAIRPHWMRSSEASPMINDRSPSALQRRPSLGIRPGFRLAMFLKSKA